MQRRLRKTQDNLRSELFGAHSYMPLWMSDEDLMGWFRPSTVDILDAYEAFASKLTSSSSACESAATAVP
jgi:hypothetical protein